ncbi:MAG: amino terminal protease self-immunity [Gemmataceae bacterium]|nr:amino terminal protease self-immunity [Gemmataceae bacterium]
MPRFIRDIWERWFGEPLRKVEDAALAYRLSPAGRGLDWKTVTVILTAAACLTIQNYASHPDRLTPLAGFVADRAVGPGARREVEVTLRDWTHAQGPRLLWSGITAVLTYTLLPVLVIKLAFRERLTDYGTGVRGVVADWPVYIAFAVVMIPLVWLFSGEERFQDMYPFYHVTSPTEVGHAFVRWEVVYALQFVGLEFFFRGFMVHGTKHRFGAYAVFVMVIPYCMIHYHKPVPEAIGSILAGVALGLVSLVTRSVWPGAALHIMVAWGMDLSCLIRRGMIG